MGAYFSFFGQSGRDNQQLTEMVGNAEFNNPNSRDEAMNDEDEMDAVADENNTMHDSEMRTRARKSQNWNIPFWISGWTASTASSMFSSTRTTRFTSSSKPFYKTAGIFV